MCVLAASERVYLTVSRRVLDLFAQLHAWALSPAPAPPPLFAQRARLG